MANCHTRRYARLLAATAASCTASGVGSGWDADSYDFWPTAVSVSGPSDERQWAARRAPMQELRSSILSMAAKEASVNKSNRGGWQSATPNLLFMLTGAAGARARAEVQAALEGHLRGLSEPGSPQPLGGRALVRIVHSWANVNAWGDWNAPHMHPGSDLSGALYVSCPGSKPCSLVLEDGRPRAHAGWESLLREHANASGEHGLQMPEGSIAVFPGWLKHYVPPVLDSEAKHHAQRITLSFNARVLLQPGPPPLSVRFESPKTAAASGVAEGARVASQPQELWPTQVTTAYPSSSGMRGHMASMQSLRASLPARATELLGLSGQTEASLPGMIAARRQAEASIEAHLLRQAAVVGLHSGEAVVRFASSWATPHRSLPLRRPHGHPGSDLSGVLCVSCPEGAPYVLELEDPRAAAAGAVDTPLGALLGSGLPNFLRLWEPGVMVFPSWLDHYAEPKGEDEGVGRHLWTLISFGAKVDLRPDSRPFRVRFEVAPQASEGEL